MWVILGYGDDDTRRTEAVRCSLREVPRSVGGCEDKETRCRSHIEGPEPYQSWNVILHCRKYAPYGVFKLLWSEIVVRYEVVVAS